MQPEIHSKSITLVLTHQCNLRCIYCYEKHKDSSVMSIELAKEIIDRELTEDDGKDEVEIDLFGGEALLEFETVRALIEYAESQSYPKDYIFFITTNGTTLTDEQKKWLSEHTDTLQLGLSLDGNKYMQDINRCNSFDKIDLEFFAKTYPEQGVKMTVSTKTLPHLADGVIFCHEKGFDVSCNLAYGIDWSDEENKSVFERELMKLIQYYLGNPSVKPCAMLDVTRLRSMSLVDDKNLRYCGAGYAMKAYDFDGTAYPCQHFLPLSIGRDQAMESLKIDFKEYVLEEDVMPDVCRKCVMRNICPTCYGENFSATGSIHLRDMDLCPLFKIQFRALAYFAAEKFRLGQYGDMDNGEVALILKSALMINEKL